MPTKIMEQELAENEAAPGMGNALGMTNPLMTYRPPLQIRQASGGFIVAWQDASGAYREAVVTSVNKMLPVLKEAFGGKG